MTRARAVARSTTGTDAFASRTRTATVAATDATPCTGSETPKRIAVDTSGSGDSLLMIELRSVTSVSFEVTSVDELAFSGSDTAIPAASTVSSATPNAPSEIPIEGVPPWAPGSHAEGTRIIIFPRPVSSVNHFDSNVEFVVFPSASKFANLAASANAASPPIAAATRATATVGSFRQSNAFFISIGGNNAPGTTSGKSFGGTNKGATTASPACMAAVTCFATIGPSAELAASAAADSTDDFKSGTSALSTPAPEPEKSRLAILTRAEHAVASAVDGSVAVDPSRGDNARVRETSESFTRAFRLPESDIECTSQRPEHSQAAPFTVRLAVAAAASVSLRSAPIWNDSQNTSVSATVSPPSFRNWFGTATRNPRSHSSSQSSAVRADAAAPHTSTHHKTTTKTARADPWSLIFASSPRVRRAECGTSSPQI